MSQVTCDLCFSRGVETCECKPKAPRKPRKKKESKTADAPKSDAPRLAQTPSARPARTVAARPSRQGRVADPNNIVMVRGRVERTFTASALWSAGLFKLSEGGVFKFAGPVYISPDEIVTWQGCWTEHPEYGFQFSIMHPVYEQTLDVEGLVHYLANNPKMKGIGSVKAKKIADTYGTNFDHAINEQTEEVGQLVGLSPQLLAVVRDEWNAYRKMNSSMTILSKYGLSYHQVRKLIEKFGQNSVKILSDNPYLILGEVEDFGFKKVDDLALKTGLSKNNKNRMRAGVLYCVQKRLNAGDCWLELPELINIANHELILDSLDSKQKIEKTVADLIKDGKLACVEIHDRQLIAIPQIYRVECELADWFSQGFRPNPHFKNLTNVEETVKRKFPTLNEKQRLGMAMALKHCQVLISGAAGVGKAQSLEMPVLTPDGFKKMGDIVVGDKVITPDNQIASVLGVFPQGEIDIYKINFTDGTSTECGLDHLWFTKTALDRESEISYKRGSVKTLEEIKSTLIHNKKHNHSIPMVSPIDFPKKKLPIEPYLLGVLLGDGCLQNIVGFTGNNKELQAAVASEVSKLGLKLTPNREMDFRIVKNPALVWKTNANPLIAKVKSLGLNCKKSFEKFIPEIYKFSTVSDRIKILRGLMDTDGTVSRDGRAVSFTSTSDKLSLDVKFLVESLGGKAVRKQRYTNYCYKGEKKQGRLAYTLHISMPPSINPFKISWKANRYVPRTKYKPTRYVTGVEYLGKKPAKCILIDHPKHLYITNNFIVTHNTYWTQAICDFYESHGLKVELVSPTGKAAKRLSELSGRRTYTIHRLIGFNGRTFTRKEGEYVDADLICVDECSMVDIQVMWHLFRSIDRKRTCLVFLGDHHQLAPVGAGNILRDMIERQMVPTVILTEVLRQAGILKENSFKVLNGIVAETAKIDGVGPWYVQKVRDNGMVSSDEVARQVISELYEKYLTEKMGFDLIRDVQLLVPQKGGSIGVDSLNLMLQKLIQKKLYNFDVPPGPPGKSPPLYPNDRVIQTKRNNYELDVMNGESGTVVETHPDGMMKVLFGGREVVLSTTEAKFLELSYALTFHKSQGDEWPCVIVLIHKAHAFMHDRSLFYTGVTRARKTAITIGDAWGLKNCVEQQRSINRKTFLSLLPLERKPMVG